MLIVHLSTFFTHSPYFSSRYLVVKVFSGCCTKNPTTLDLKSFVLFHFQITFSIWCSGSLLSCFVTCLKTGVQLHGGNLSRFNYSYYLILPQGPLKCLKVLTRLSRDKGKFMVVKTNVFMKICEVLPSNKIENHYFF